MNPQFPRIPECLDHLRFLRQIFILAVFDIALVHEGLKVRPVLNAIRWIDVDHLHPTGHTLFLQQAVHHQERITRGEAVRPALFVVIKIERFT